MKTISKGPLAGCLVHLDAGRTDRLAQQNKTFRFLSMLVTGLYPAGFLMLVYLQEIDSPPVALTPFWSLSYLPRNSNC